MPWPMMWRLQYRNFGNHETLVGNLTTDVDPSSTIHAGVRWFELRRTPPGTGPWQEYQEGTQAPDADNRWMGSVAMDGCGGMALGYSIASATTAPSIRYTGRLAGDALGTMPQGPSPPDPLLPPGEGLIIAGTDSQVNISRWGDYSSMNVDEADQCTFWYTNEYVVPPDRPAIPFPHWQTRIASFRFPGCPPPLLPSPGDEVPNTSLRVIKETLDPTHALRLDWAAVTNATTYNVYRGDIDSLFVGRVYNHAFSPTGAGACGEPNTFFVDPNDQDDPTDFYYLVTAKSCLVEGTTGFDSFGIQRPAGSGCP